MGAMSEAHDVLAKLLVAPDWADTVRDGCYTLDADNNVIPATPRQMEDILRDVGRRRVGSYAKLANGVEVSTVFLGVDHYWGPPDANGGHTPVVFESAAFAPMTDEPDKALQGLSGWVPRFGEMLAQERYTTWADAVAGHAAMMAALADWAPGQVSDG